MIRLYLDQEFHSGDLISLPADEWRYFASVRRGKGEVRLFNRLGQEAIGRIVQKSFQVDLVETVQVPTYHLCVALALPENQALTHIVRSLSELGAKELILFSGARSQSASKRLKEISRLERVSIESARQCGRGTPLELRTAKNIFSIPLDTNAPVLFCDEDSTTENRIIPEFLSALSIVVGCEGGWTEEERAFARESRFVPVHFKTPILRVETAVVAAAFYAIGRMQKK
jgi:16S rRNA (uracil1498-N3)-methyltransferase